MAFRSLMVNVSELDRLATEGAAVAQRETVLMKVTAAAAISGATKRWLYTVQPARVGAAPTYTPALEVDVDVEADALSVSELSNDATGRLQLRRRSDEPARQFRCRPDTRRQLCSLRAARDRGRRVHLPDRKHPGHRRRVHLR
jgi:hypothetical protein